MSLNLPSLVQAATGNGTPDGMDYDALIPLLDCLAEEHDPRWAMLVQVIGRAPAAGRDLGMTHNNKKFLRQRFAEEFYALFWPEICDGAAVGVQQLKELLTVSKKQPAEEFTRLMERKA